MAIGIVIPVDQAQPMRAQVFVALADYTAAVDGWIEAVEIPSLDVLLYVDEEGLVRRRRFNPRASALWSMHVPGVSSEASLFGDAVLVGIPNSSGDEVDVPADLQAKLLNRDEHVIESNVSEEWKLQAVASSYGEALVWAAELRRLLVIGAERIRILPAEQ
jgi:hypothetical protein